MPKARKFFTYIGADGKRHRWDIQGWDMFNRVSELHYKTGYWPELALLEARRSAMGAIFEEMSALLVEHSPKLAAWQRDGAQRALEEMQYSLAQVRRAVHPDSGLNGFFQLRHGDLFFEALEQFEANFSGHEGGKIPHELRGTE